MSSSELARIEEHRQPNGEFGYRPRTSPADPLTDAPKFVSDSAMDVLDDLDCKGEKQLFWRDIEKAYNRPADPVLREQMEFVLPHLTEGARAAYTRELMSLELTRAWLENDVDHEGIRDFIDENYDQWGETVEQCQFRSFDGDFDTDWADVASRVRDDYRFQAQIVWDRALRDNAGAAATLDAGTARHTG